MPSKPFTIAEVNQEGLCVGCGACAVVDKSVRIERNQLGEMVADFSLTDLSSSPADLVCPFSDNSQNEDSIAEQLYNSCESYDPRVGFFSKIYSGRRVDEDILLNSSSG